MEGLFVQAVVFLAASLILVKSASYAVKRILHLAQLLSLTPFFTSFVVAGFVSIMPEFFVGVNAALEHVPEVGIGTLIGNNIVDLTLVMGVIAILGRVIPTRSQTRVSTLPFLVAVGLPLGLMLDGNLSFLDGLLLVLGCLLYFGWFAQQQGVRDRHSPWSLNLIIPELLKFAVAAVVIFFSAKFVVESSIGIAGILHFPEIFAGLFLISIGAALPELTFSVEAILSRHKNIALGDVLGNVAVDSTFSIGVMAMIYPFDISLGVIGISALFMVFAAMLLTTFLDSEGKLTRRDGIALIGLFVVFVVVQLTIHAAQEIIANGAMPH
ncbi:MAG: sodium:calcium antiporter [Candidatus Iainarchaeum archaeon]|uniref:Sodium:calcium antiporter n=1 Tax=Candidatus Iainarchaeum sp. TaxID=3101447 RepID=A0A7T9I175_9ARCH|nr:MAG: sodium:calcium antiporter [Candidatus Diapherotrites archaeon]